MNKVLNILIIISISLWVIPLSEQVTADLSFSTITAPEIVEEGQTIFIIIDVANNSGLIVGAVVLLQANNGTFPIQGGHELVGEFAIEGISDINGRVNFTWQAPIIDFQNEETFIDLVVDISTFSDNIQLIDQIKVVLPSSSLDGSEIISSETVDAGEEIIIQIRAANEFNTPRANTFVNVFSGDGNFTTATEGVTDNDGIFSVTWIAPLLSVEIPQINATINATLIANAVTNITIQQIIIVSLNNNSISGSIIVPTFILEETTTPVGIQLDGSNIFLGGIEVLLTANQGIFNGTIDETSILLETDINGYTETNWTAPFLPTIDNTNITLGFAAQVGDYILEVSNITTVTPGPPKTLTTTWTAPQNTIKQNELISVSVNIQDEVSNTNLTDVDITLTTEYGFWEESRTPILSVNSGSTSSLLGTLNLKSEWFFNEINSVNILATIGKDRYTTSATNTTLSIERVPLSASVVVGLSSNSVVAGEEVSISMSTYLEDAIWSNTTIRIISSAGVFDNNESTFLTRSDSNGLITLTWFANLLPLFENTLNVSFVVTITNPQVISIPNEFNIILQPADITTLPSETAQSDELVSNIKENPEIAYTIAGGSAVILGILGGIVVYKKKSK